MKRASPKKSTEAKRKTKSPAKSPKAVTQGSPTHRSAKSVEEQCFYCSKSLQTEDRVLFVEEEVGRIFCKEACIASYFAPEIERFEKEFLRRVSSRDLDSEEREKLAHLRWITLQEPDEIWREKTLTGDYRYTLISEFRPGDRKVWCVCLCLFLRGEPSFLYMSFPTNDLQLTDAYRRGERMEWVRNKNGGACAAEPLSGTEFTRDHHMDRLADEWTEDETILAQLNRERDPSDIPQEDFSLYQRCLEETLEEPDEIWSSQLGSVDSLRLFHFIRHYSDERPSLWYVIVARETDEEEQIEILDAFPTKDPHLVDRYRRGDQEIGIVEHRSAPNRVVH